MSGEGVECDVKKRISLQTDGQAIMGDRALEGQVKIRKDLVYHTLPLFVVFWDGVFRQAPCSAGTEESQVHDFICLRRSSRFLVA